MKTLALLTFALISLAGCTTAEAEDGNTPTIEEQIEKLRFECDEAVSCLQTECADEESLLATHYLEQPDFEQEPEAWEIWEEEHSALGSALESCRESCVSPTPWTEAQTAWVQYEVICQDVDMPVRSCAMGHALLAYDNEEGDDTCDGLYDGA